MAEIVSLKKYRKGKLPGTEAVKKAVEANLGIGFVSSFAVEREVAIGDLTLVGIDGFEITRHMELIYRSQKYFSPIAQRFREFIHRYAEGIRPISAREPGIKARVRHPRGRR